VHTADNRAEYLRSAEAVAPPSPKPGHWHHSRPASGRTHGGVGNGAGRKQSSSSSSSNGAVQRSTVGRRHRPAALVVPAATALQARLAAATRTGAALVGACTAEMAVMIRALRRLRGSPTERRCRMCGQSGKMRHMTLSAREGRDGELQLRQFCS